MTIAEKAAAPRAWLNAIAFAAFAALWASAVSRDEPGMLAYLPAAQVMAWGLSPVSIAAHAVSLARARGRGALVVVLGMLLAAIGHFIAAGGVSILPHTAPGPGPGDAGAAMALMFMAMWLIVWLVLTAVFTALLSEFVILRKGEQSLLTLLAAAAIVFSLLGMGLPHGGAIAAGLIAAWWALAGFALLPDGAKRAAGSLKRRVGNLLSD